MADDVVIGDALQRGIYSALASAGVCGGRIFDQVPRGVAFPYVTIGDEQVTAEPNSCGTSWEVFSDIHIWSRPDSGSKRELKQIISAVDAAILPMTAVAGFLLSGVRLDTSRTRREPDGLTEHAILTFRFLVDPE